MQAEAIVDGAQLLKNKIIEEAKREASEIQTGSADPIRGNKMPNTRKRSVPAQDEENSGDQLPSPSCHETPVSQVDVNTQDDDSPTGGAKQAEVDEPAEGLPTENLGAPAADESAASEVESTETESAKGQQEDDEPNRDSTTKRRAIALRKSTRSERGGQRKRLRKSGTFTEPASATASSTSNAQDVPQPRASRRKRKAEELRAHDESDSFGVGDRVVGNFGGNGEWYPGSIFAVASSPTPIPYSVARYRNY